MTHHSATHILIDQLQRLFIYYCIDHLIITNFSWVLIIFLGVEVYLGFL